MAIIVDKVQKRKDIALSCKALFLEKGLKNLTIAEVAKTAGVGKGTIYEYFKNKEEIVFEIVSSLMIRHNQTKEHKLSQVTSTREKTKVFFSIFYDDDEDFELRELYKEFISISLARDTSQDTMMADFQSNTSAKYLLWFEKIIEEGIQKGELIPNAQKLARGLFVLGEGMFIYSQTTNNIQNVKKELYSFYETLFELIEVKK